MGNKCDMEDERVISYERGKQLADSLGLEFFETSAKEGINVSEAFTEMIDLVYKSKFARQDDDEGAIAAAPQQREGTIKLSRASEKKVEAAKEQKGGKKKGCC